MPMHYIAIRYSKQMVQMAFCALSQRFHQKITDVPGSCLLLEIVKTHPMQNIVSHLP